MISEEWARSALLLGEENIQKLSKCRVALFGLGGVGSYAAEGLARTGIGSFVLVDNDTVSLSNINRQLIATHDSLGRPKALVEQERILSINPKAEVRIHQTFYLPGEGQGLIQGCDYVVDAIDTVAGKLALAEEAREWGIPLISSMGTGNKLDPTQLRVADIYETSGCPLCQVMRRELRRRGFSNMKVVYSTEPPVTHRLAQGEAPDGSAPLPGKHTPGSVAFVPSVAGLIIASEVIKDLIAQLSPQST